MKEYRCPVCASEHMTSGDIDFDDWSEIMVSMKCDECLASWKSRFVFREDVEVLDGEIGEEIVVTHTNKGNE